MGRHLYKYRMHEPANSRYLARHLVLEPGDVILDVCANIGWYSLSLNRIAPHGVAIHAFEPDPWVRALLEENVRLNGAAAVTPVAAAVGESSGRAQLPLYGDANRGRSSLLPINAGEVIDVDVVSLDEYLRRVGAANRPVGFLKIDVLDLLGASGFTPERLGGDAPVPVERAALLAGSRNCDLLWRRGD